MRVDDCPTISQVFEILNCWRHLPHYSLETRAAPFFAVFLRNVLSAHFGAEIHEIVIPDFPLRIGTLNPSEEDKGRGSAAGNNPSTDQSYNVDYVAFGKWNMTAYLVELKTDLASIRKEQQRYLSDAQSKPFRDLVEGVRQMARVSNRKQKYVHLLHRLAAPGLGLVNMPDQLYEKSFGNVRPSPGWTHALNAQTVSTKPISNIEVVFVQPTEHKKCEKFHYIYFDEITGIVQRRGDLGGLFANYLRQWTEPAGSRDPRIVWP